VATLSLSVFAGSWLCVAALLAACPWALDAFAGGGKGKGRGDGGGENGTDEATRLAALTLAATIAGARSPAAAVAVLKETNGAGAFCSLVVREFSFEVFLFLLCFPFFFPFRGAPRREKEKNLLLFISPFLFPALPLSISHSSTSPDGRGHRQGRAGVRGVRDEPGACRGGAAEEESSFVGGGSGGGRRS
jgi:hypothetical protein